jgi:hypothetical protein
MITFISVTSSFINQSNNIMARMGAMGETRQEQNNGEEKQQEFVGPTLCISRTHKNIRQERIFAVLRQLNLGWVGKIDIVQKKNVEKNPDGTETTKEFVRVFIHFTKWFTNNRQTQQFLERLDSQGFVHIVYDEPWFWKVTKYVPKERKPQPQSRYPRPRIDFAATAAAPAPAVAVKESTNHHDPANPIVPVQVTRRLQSVSVRGSKNNGNDTQYWRHQAEISTAATMSKHQPVTPTPRSHGSDSESSPSPMIQRNVSVRLFD